MKNEVKKSFIIAVLCLIVGYVNGTPLANLNFSEPTTLPGSYTYSSANTPSIVNNIGGKNCIYVANGGGSQYPSFGSDGSVTSTTGKRWMAFCPDEDCSVVISVYSNKKKFELYDSNGSFAEYTNENKNVWEDWTVTGLKAGKWYVLGAANSQCYVKSMNFTATGGGGETTPTVNSVTVSPASVTLDPNGTQQLTANVDATPASADKSVTWTSSNPSVATVSESGLVTAVAQGTATITATSNLDNTKSGTCSVTVNAPAAPIPVTAISLNKSATTIGIGSSETLTVNYTPADANTGKAVSWSSSNTSIATVDNSGKVTGVAAGSATITATSTTDNNITASCAVTVQAVAVTGVSINPTSANLQIGGSTDLTYTILPANATDKSVSWSSSNTAVANVNNNGHVTAVAAGTATITVTTTDGNKTASCTVTVSAAVQSGLTIHVPEVYEAKTLAGGYGGTLAVFGGREYEVYYAGKTSESLMTVDIKPNQKQPGIAVDNTSTSCKAPDGWFEAATTSISNYTNTDIDEFVAGTGSVHKMQGCSYKMHIQGFDQFSIQAADKNVEIKDGAFRKNQRFQVFIDNTMQPEDQASTNTTIRRYNITTGEHVIEVKALGDGASLFYGFSLRIAQEPRTKWLKGNDSAQVVLQTTSIKPIIYATKYNNIPGAETRLEWIGAQAEGITLAKTEGSLTDTLTITGTASCPTGIYQYAVVAYYNGVETSRVKGKFRVASDIQATSEIDIDAYQNEEMDQITFKYYALSADDVQLTWPNGQPQGISGNGNNGKYIIGGTPNVSGTLPQTFPFTITVAGADSIIQGKITIKALDYGQNAVLYLYKNNKAYVKDGVYKYLDGAGKYNLIARRAKEDGLRPAVQYANYKWVLISEDVDADNQEALALARGESDLPVLSMKSFSYTPGRLNWGEPNNGSLTMEEGRYITVQRADHPIFQALGKQRGDRIMVLDTVVGKGLMPVAVNFSGTLCLATARTRSIDDYYADGPEETFLHEVPSDMHGGRKYICLPIGLEGSNYLSSQGKKLIDETIKYLLGAQASITLPDLAITDFRIGNYVGRINDSENLILVPVLQSDSDLMKTAVPQITLASPLTHVTPAVSNEDGSVDFSNWHYGVRYTVSDYINTRSYDVLVQLYDPQGIDAVYTPGEWVNIYDMQGRKLTTTNEDIRQMALPTGVYIVVTENGTFKLTR
jgi:uncharacterized protein YjdB